MRLKKIITYILLLLLAAALSITGKSQNINSLGRRLGTSNSNVAYDSQGRPIKKNNANDSLKHRDPLEDSITISYRYYDSTRVRKLDSSISNFYSRFPVPQTYVDLGNLGTAAKSLIFTPNMKAGWDAGFHALDIYRYNIEGTKFFTTTRPYTEMAYMIGSKAEQMINIIHTQNRKSGVNFTFEYRFINAPGTFKNQNSNDNNIRLNLSYQTKNKRYGWYLIYLSNSLKTSENGGLTRDSNLDSLSLTGPFSADVRLGNSKATTANPFNTNITTGTIYTEKTILFRHFYDLGQKDSIVTDSSTIKLFYPRFRLQHTFKYSSYTYTYKDQNPVDNDYLNFYNYFNFADTIMYQDKWSEVTNDFSIISYPQKNNLSQFLKLGGGIQLLKGTFNPYSKNYSNIYIGGEYRNRSKNQKWDIEASGQLYVNGGYSGDYAALISLKRFLSKKLGYLEVGFQNTNRSASFIYNPLTSFPSLTDSTFKKENIVRLFANLDIPVLQLRLFGEYYAVTNYTYFDSYFTSRQESALFNVLHIGGEKKFRLNHFFNLYAQLHVQQKTGNPSINMPLITSINRIAFEGNFYKNLYLSTGMELRYYSAYTPDNYSPLTGQFFYQNDYKTKNVPDINIFANIRIKSFKGFLRLENINAFYKGVHNFNFPHYAAPYTWLRFGIWWSFVN